MKNKSYLRKSESGQVLVYVTIIFAVACLILGPLLQFAFTSYRSARIREERTLELYAADTGIEDALYQIKMEDEMNALASLSFGGDNYDTGTPGVNDRDVDVTIEKVWLPEGLPTDEPPINRPGYPKDWTTPEPVNDDNPPFDEDTDKSDKLVVVGMLTSVEAAAASDDFESGGWSGGSGNWTGSWTPAGSASIGSGLDAHGGTYYLGFADSAGNATRQLNLPRYMEPRLQFWAKAKSLEASDTAACMVSSDGVNWTPLETWTDGNDTGAYDFYDIDLYGDYGYGGANVTTPLWVAFDASMAAVIVASDNFASGGWSGGSGWAGSWQPNSYAGIVNSGSPNSDPNHLRLSRTGYALRTVDLSDYDMARLQFWAKASNFGGSPNDIAYLKVSPNGTTWTTLRSWTLNQGYQFVDVDLSPYVSGSSQFRIAFETNLSTGTIAEDSFQTSSWSGGSGWTGAWQRSGSSYPVITTSGSPHSSPRHLLIQGTQWAYRAADISDFDAPHLKFWGKTVSFESGDRAYCKVSSDGINWQTARTWTSTQSYQLIDIDLSAYVPGASRVWVRFEGAMNSSSGDYFYIDDVSIVDNGHFYVDDVQIRDVDGFCVDDVWVGSALYKCEIEIAYTTPDFDPTITGSPNDPAYLSRLGVWMPPGCHYVNVAESTGITTSDPDISPPTYAGGTVLEWDFTSPGVALHQGSGWPLVKSLTFVFTAREVPTGFFTWMEANETTSNPQKTYLSWDKGYEIYKAVSQAHSEIYGSNTLIQAYVSQGEVNKRNVATYGDYVATGNPLMIDYTGSNTVKERAIDPIKDPIIYPTDPARWVSKDGYYYDGRSEITSTPSDTKGLAAWLYWAAFVRNSEWSAPDTNVSFMYPKRYGPETFSAYAGNGNDAYTIAAYTQYSEPMDLLAKEPVLALTPKRYPGEYLGIAVNGNGNDTFQTDYKPILASPEVKVKLGASQLLPSKYTIDYAAGNVTITDDSLSGQIYIDYSISGSMVLTKYTDYTINQTAEGTGYKYTGFTIINDNLVGSVTVQPYYAKHWEPVQHAAYDRYGTFLPPAETLVPPSSPVGHTYACFADVTSLLTGNSTYRDSTGKGQYAVRNIQATPGVDGSEYATRSFSGWSLIVLYKSETEPAHQFYLYDPIHNAADCPFQKVPNSPPTDFTLRDFYPPEGTVEGRTTYFVGEGDWVYTGDSMGFKGASQENYTWLSGLYNPEQDVMNTQSTTGEKGIDIDTYDIWGEVGSDTEANVRLITDEDRWYVIYMILSFRTNVTPKPDYAYDVSSITYAYELGATQ